MADLGEPDTLAVQNKPPQLQEGLPNSPDNKATPDAAAADADTDAPCRDAKRRRCAAAASTLELGVLYKPQTKEAIRAYEALLVCVQRQLALGGQPLDALAGPRAAHQVLAVLKNDKLTSPDDKKNAIDQVFPSAIPYQLFHNLVYIGTFITDFHDAAHGGAPPGNAVDTTTTTPDGDGGVAVEFEGKGQDHKTDSHQVHILRRRRCADASTLDLGVLYEPQSKDTRAAYEALLGGVQRQLALGGQPLDALAGPRAAHQVLAVLKNDKLISPADKKNAIDQLFPSTIPYQLFYHLVFIASFITDFHDAAHGGAPPGNAVDTTTTLDGDGGVAVEFEGKGQDHNTNFHQVQVRDEIGEDEVAELGDDDIDFILSLDLDKENMLYKPRTKETRAAYKALLRVLWQQQQLLRREPLDVFAWIVDNLLAILKNDKLNNPADKKKEIDELLWNTISSQLFDQLVYLSNLLTDYPDAAARDAAGPEGSGSSKTSQSADTTSSSESVDQFKTQNAQILSMKRQKIQILREMLDLQKRDMEWRKKQHEENISLRKRDIELGEKQVEAQLFTAEAGIMAVDLEKVAPYMKNYYLGMQRQIMEKRVFSSPPNS